MIHIPISAAVAQVEYYEKRRMSQAEVRSLFVDMVMEVGHEVPDQPLGRHPMGEGEKGQEKQTQKGEKTA